MTRWPKERISALTPIPFDIAWKLVAANLSDLASNGAEPVGVLLGHMLGEDDARFLEGLRAILGEFNVPASRRRYDP